MNLFRVIWYGLYGMVICPWGIVLCITGALTAHDVVDRLVLVILAVLMFFFGKMSLRKMRENL
jgi:hypothetical protein